MHNRAVKIIFFIAVGLIVAKAAAGALISYWPEAADALALSGGQAGADKLIQLTNEYRRDNNLNTLTVNPRLTQAAVNKAKDILAKQYFSHTSPDGRKFSDWIKDVNYSYFYVGENLAIDFTNPQDVFAAWLNSPKHKENIVRPEFQEIGIADISGEFEGHQTQVVVQLFGSRVLGASETPTSTASSTPAALAASQNSLAGLTLANAANFDYRRLLVQADGWLTWAIVAAAVLLLLFLTRAKKPKVGPSAVLQKKSPRDFTAQNTTSTGSPLKSLYTKRTLTIDENRETATGTSRPDSRKKLLIKNR